MKTHIPGQGDFVALTFDPQSGHEQKGRRPALIISHTLFNQRTGLAIACPITSQNHNYPFHVAIPKDLSVNGFIMVDQVKSVDYRARKIKFIEKCPEPLLSESLALLDACIY